MGLFTDQPEHTSDDTDVEVLSSSERISKPDYDGKGPGNDYGNSVGDESMLIAEEKAQKGMASLLQPCRSTTNYRHQPPM